MGRRDRHVKKQARAICGVVEEDGHNYAAVDACGQLVLAVVGGVCLPEDASLTVSGEDAYACGRFSQAVNGPAGDDELLCLETQRSQASPEHENERDRCGDELHCFTISRRALSVETLLSLAVSSDRTNSSESPASRPGTRTSGATSARLVPSNSNRRLPPEIELMKA